jgi:hypothetical protein
LVKKLCWCRPADGYAFIVDPLLTTPTDTDSRTVNGVNVTINQNKALYEYHGSLYLIYLVVLPILSK